MPNLLDIAIKQGYIPGGKPTNTPNTQGIVPSAPSAPVATPVQPTQKPTGSLLQQALSQGYQPVQRPKLNLMELSQRPPEPKPSVGGADLASAEQFKPTFPAQTTDYSAKSFVQEPLKTVGNIPSSAFQFAKNFVTHTLNPVETYRNIKEVLGGLAPQGFINAEDRATAERQSLEQGKVGIKEFSKELLPAAYKTLVPKFFQDLISGNFEEAQRTITNDPTGQILPVLLAGRGIAEKVGYGAQFDAITSKTAKPVIETAKNTAGAVKETIMQPVIETAKKFQPQLEKQTVESYRQVLNPTARQSSVEFRYSKNTPEFLAKEGIKLDVENGKLNPTVAIEHLQNMADVENSLFGSLLRSEQKYVNWNEVKTQMKSNVTAKGTDQYKAFKHIDDELNAYQRQYGSRFVKSAGGDPLISLDAFNEIKQDLWSKTKRFDSPDSQLFNDVNFQMGHTAKGMIEGAVQDISVREINQRLGDISSAINLLEKRRGLPIQGGRLGRYFSRVTGAIVGSAGGFFGSVIGALTAEKMAAFLQDSQIPANARMAILEQLRGTKTGAKIIQSMESLLKQRAEEVINRKALPSPSYTPMPTKTPSDSFVKGVPAQYPMTERPMLQAPSYTPLPGKTPSESSIKIINAKPAVGRNPQTGRYFKYYTTTTKAGR